MKLEAFALAGIPEVVPGNDLAALISGNVVLADGDIVVVAQKVVSKAENRFAVLDEIEPSSRAIELAQTTDKDPRLVELILRESSDVLRSRPGVLIVETRHGFVCANAGVDCSNVPGDGRVLLLPIDPDRSARELRSALQEVSGVRLALVISDSFGRAWRGGQADVAIGCAGIAPLLDLRGEDDRDGRALSASIQAVGDELASAADLARGKDSGEPVVVIRGRADLVTELDGPGAVAGLRARAEDLFR